MNDSRQNILHSLREQVRRLEVASRTSDPQAVSTGCAALDRLLPSGGIRRGTLVEWLATAAGSGTQSLALLAAREACRAGGGLVVVDRRQQFYPPAAAAWGVDLSRMMVVRPHTVNHEQWTWDQALRCSGVAAVWGEVEKLDAKTFRRWQLAAEQGQTLGLLLRSHQAQGLPSWADLQFLVMPQPDANGWRWKLTITRCRHGREGRSIELQWNEATGTVCEAKDCSIAYLTDVSG